MAGVSPVRASDDDRDRIVRALGDALAQGRLSHDSFVGRVDLALRARDQDALGELVTDLVAADPLGGGGLRPRLPWLRRRLVAADRGRPRLTPPAGSRRPVLVIGRRPNCDVTLSDRRVSRVHALLMLLGEQWFLEDLRSTNGTYVNGARIGVATVVRPGDWISFGGLLMRFDRPLFRSWPARQSRWA